MKFKVATSNPRNLKKGVMIALQREEETHKKTQRPKKPGRREER